MAYKIAYLTSKVFEHSPADEFCEFAKANGVDFCVENFELAHLTPDDSFSIATANAIIISSSINADCNLAPLIANKLNLYARCAFKPANSDNLTHSNTIVVSDVPTLENGELGVSSQFGREASITLRYSEIEIERTARIAYEFAEARDKKLTLSDTTAPRHLTMLWRKIVSDINEDYPSVHLEFESVFETTKKLVSSNADYDVLLTTETYFDAFSSMADKYSPLGDGTATIAYLGETTVGLYATERPAVFSPLLDSLAISKMLDHSFDLAPLSEAWKEKINHNLPN